MEILSIRSSAFVNRFDWHACFSGLAWNVHAPLSLFCSADENGFADFAVSLCFVFFVMRWSHCRLWAILPGKSSGRSWVCSFGAASVGCSFCSGRRGGPAAPPFAPQTRLAPCTFTRHSFSLFALFAPSFSFFHLLHRDKFGLWVFARWIGRIFACMDCWWRRLGSQWAGPGSLGSLVRSIFEVVLVHQCLVIYWLSLYLPNFFLLKPSMI